MRILVQEEPIEATEFDDVATLVDRYAYAHNSLPSYYRTEDEVSELYEGEEIDLRDIRDELVDVEYDKLADAAVGLLKLYPDIRPRTLGILWLQRHGVPRTKIEQNLVADELRKIDATAFFSITSAKIELEKYEKEFPKELEELKKKIEEHNAVLKKFKKIESVETKEFDVEDVTYSMTLNLPDGEDLFAIFDAIDASEDIPYVSLVYKGKRFYKVYTHELPRDDWLSYVAPADGIYFRVLTLPKEQVTSKNKNNAHSLGKWFGSDEGGTNVVEVELKKGYIEARDKIFAALGDRISYEKVDDKQISIRGTFVVPNININRLVFADLGMNDKIVSRFIFFGEAKGTVLSKHRLTFYYYPNHNLSNVKKPEPFITIFGKSMTITATPLEDPSKGFITRCSRAKNIAQVNAFRSVFSKLLGVYLESKDEILKVYSEFVKVDAEKERKAAYRAKVKEKKVKAVKRIAQLREALPDMFAVGRYGVQCTSFKQPYLVEKDDVAQFIEEHGQEKILNYPPNSDNWFACEPRLPTDKDDRHIFPGLQKNNDPDARAKGFLYAPCCFTEDKSADTMRKLEAGRGGTVVGGTLVKGAPLSPVVEEEEEEERYNPTVLGHVLESNKPTKKGRYARLPFYLAQLVESIGIPQVTISTATFLPILRYGVSRTQASVLHCLEIAFNRTFLGMTNEVRRQRIRDVRGELASDTQALTLCDQELFDYTEETVVDLLADETKFLDTLLFKKLLEAYYKCNIFVILCTPQNERKGEIEVPRSSEAYLLSDIDPTKQSIVLCKYESEEFGYPFQYDIVADVTFKKTNIVDVNFIIDPSSDIHRLVEDLIRATYEANEVQIVFPDKYSLYTPITFL